MIPYRATGTATRSWRTAKRGALAAIDETNQQKEALREQCGVDADSQEQQDLLLLEKEQDYKNGVLDEGLTDEEYDRLAEIHKKPLTGYQKQALELNNYAAGHKREIRRADYGMTAEKQNVSPYQAGALEDACDG